MGKVVFFLDIEDERRLTFEWDARKSPDNSKKHGVKFEEAVTIFKNKETLTVEDTRRDYRETRYISLGFGVHHTDLSWLGVGTVLWPGVGTVLWRDRAVVCVVHTQRGDNLRIISARKAHKKERRAFHDSLSKTAPPDIA